MSKRHREGVVYSTNPDFQYQYDEEPEAETLEPASQKLRVNIERRHRGGKTATVVRGFVGTEGDLGDLARTLKTRLGVGGSAGDGEIIIQGDLKEKTVAILHSLGYSDAR